MPSGRSPPSGGIAGALNGLEFERDEREGGNSKYARSVRGRVSMERRIGRVIGSMPVQRIGEQQLCQKHLQDIFYTNIFQDTRTYHQEAFL